MKIITWNINGLRSGFEKLQELAAAERPDIICLQEIKISPDDTHDGYKKFASYTGYFCHAQKKGYSGVAIYSLTKPNQVTCGLGNAEIDAEGRAIVARYDDFDLVNYYFPHSNRELSRLPFKEKFNQAFLDHLNKFDQNRLIVCGDLNVAHEEIDLARPKDNRKNAGFTDIERHWMDKILNFGLKDIFRELYPDKVQYTWWSNFFHARDKNIGWRIDYFLCNEKFFSKIKDCRIENKYLGSDHCPVILEF